MNSYLSDPFRQELGHVGTVLVDVLNLSLVLDNEISTWRLRRLDKGMQKNPPRYGVEHFLPR